jgi:hypothetical protein
MGDAGSMNDRAVNVGVCCGKPRERNYLEDLDMDGRIILNSNYGKICLGHGLHCSGSG